jgi:hypothetical protein
MGIKDLKKLVKDKGEYEGTVVPLKDLRKLIGGSIMPTDASIYLYRYSYMETIYIFGFIEQIKRLISNGIIPFYVFDSEPPLEKEYTILERKERKAKNS